MRSMKNSVIHTSIIIGFSVVFSLVLSCIAALIQQNSSISYSVMGNTLPSWFYFILSINAVFYIIGFVKFFLVAKSFLFESGILSRPIRSKAVERVHTVQGEFDGVDVVQPVFTDVNNYHPVLEISK